MVSCFFEQTGHAATPSLEEREMVNSEWYITICFLDVFYEIRKTNKHRWIILHQEALS